MKKYASLSLSLLLSIPVMAMEQQLTKTAAQATENILKNPKTEAQAIQDSYTEADARVARNIQDLAQEFKRRAQKLTAQVEANKATTPTINYESDTEIGLDPENVQLYRLSKQLHKTTRILQDAQPCLREFLKKGDSISRLSDDLENQTTRVEMWIKQCGESSSSSTSAFKKLKMALEVFEKQFERENKELFEKSLIGNISHPVNKFMINVDALHQLIRQTR